MIVFKLIDAAIAVLAIVLAGCVYLIALEYRAPTADNNGGAEIIHQNPTGQAPAAGAETLKKGELVFIVNVPIVRQMPRWPTGCEIVATKMLAEFYGVNKSVDDWINLLPRGDVYTQNGKLYGPDPREMFVGNPYSNAGYGVYHQPIMRMLKPYFGDRLINMTGLPFSEYEKMVRTGNPIAIWGTIWNRDIEPRRTWTTPTGEEFQWNGNAHCMVLVGYTNTHVFLNDPYSGSLVKHDKKTFLERWEVMGRQGIAIRP